MSDRLLLCKVYGNGDPDAPLTPTTGVYRAAIADIIDPDTGTKAFVVNAPIGTPGGVLANPWVVAVARGTRWDVIKGNADIVEIATQGLRTARIGALPVAARTAMLAKATAEGFNISALDGESSIAELVTTLVKAHDAGLDSNALDLPE